MPGDKPLPKPQHEIYAQHRARGVSVTDAYRCAGYASKSDLSARANGARLSLRQDVRDRIRYLQLTDVDAATAHPSDRSHARSLSIAAKRELLFRIATDPKSSPQAITAAIKMDSELAGDLAPTKSYAITAQLDAETRGSAELSRQMRAAAIDLAAREEAERKGMLREYLESTMMPDDYHSGDRLARNDGVGGPDNEAIGHPGAATLTLATSCDQ